MAEETLRVWWTSSPPLIGVSIIAQGSGKFGKEKVNQVDLQRPYTFSLYSTQPVQNIDRVAAQYLLLSVPSLRVGRQGHGEKGGSLLWWAFGKVGPSTELATFLIASIRRRHG